MDLDEAGRRSHALWVDGHLVWHAWARGAAYVVGGPGEQDLPAAPGRHVEVVVRDPASRSGVAGRFGATARAVAPGSPEWDEVAPLLAAARQNAPDGPGAPDRWARTCTVLRLSPVVSPDA